MLFQIVFAWVISKFISPSTKFANCGEKKVRKIEQKRKMNQEEEESRANDVNIFRSIIPNVKLK